MYSSNSNDGGGQETFPVLLSVEKLSVDYHAGNRVVRALREINFRLGPGESLGVIGESGSGKTTLALAMMGLVQPPHSVNGNVLLGNYDMNSLEESRRKELRWRKVALVFQNALDVLNPVMRVEEQVGEAMHRHLGLTGAALAAAVELQLATVGLEPRWREAYPHQLSGGMRQRVLLAMALSCDPELLVVDEPTSSLDAPARRDIIEMLQSLQQEKGFSLIAISHDIDTVSRLCRRVLVLYNGEIVESGPTEALIEEPRHPYTRGLLNSSVELFPHKDLWGIPGEPGSDDGEGGCSFAPRCTQAEPACRGKNPSLLLDESAGRSVRCLRGGLVPLLEGSGIVKDFALKRFTVRALDNVSLTLRHGEAAALVGESGSGKSTLAQVLAGWQAPCEGRVLFCGSEITGSGASRREGGVQLVLQDPFNAISHRLTVAGAVAEPLEINGIGNAAERRRRTAEALAAVQLPADESFMERFCFTLSGGQRQRLAVARALVMNPALLLADEITSMLDVSTQANLMRLLKGLQNSLGFAMLYITHDLHLARKVAERIYVLNEGRIVNEGSARRVSETSCCTHTRRLWSHHH